MSIWLYSVISILCVISKLAKKISLFFNCLLYKTVLLYNITKFQYTNGQICAQICAKINECGKICHLLCSSDVSQWNSALIGSAQKEDVELSQSRASERGENGRVPWSTTHNKLIWTVLQSPHPLPWIF